jgi:hypothetical protein
MAYEFMTDGVWERIRQALPDMNVMGRPRRSDRDVLEGILWVLKTGARWRDMPGSVQNFSHFGLAVIGNVVFGSCFSFREAGRRR